MSHDQAQTSLKDYVRVQVRYGCSTTTDISMLPISLAISLFLNYGISLLYESIDRIDRINQ